MFEKVNPQHPDKCMDRICGFIVDLAYSIQDNPKIAVEGILGHGCCKIMIETSLSKQDITDHLQDIYDAVDRINGYHTQTEVLYTAQDVHLANNQADTVRCGDNGIFKGMPLTEEQKKLSRIARDIYSRYPHDGKYILDGDRLIICQSNAPTEELRKLYPDAEINPLGDWTGGTEVDTGAVNRKLGSDMADSVTGGGLCVSGDTEYLSDDLLWHKISEYSGGKVAQWSNGQLEFVYPNRYIQNEKDDFIWIHNDSKLSMVLTPYHEVLVQTGKKNLIKKPAAEVAMQLLSRKGNGGDVPHWFHYTRETKSSYESENALRLQIAFCADGTILDHSSGWTGRFRVKKQRKKERLRQLLNGMEYRETEEAGGYSLFWVKIPKKCKSLYECCKDENLSIVADEVCQWDGDPLRRVYRTTNKIDADCVQLAMSSTGKCASLLISDRRGESQVVNGKEYTRKSVCYTVAERASTVTGLKVSKGVAISVDFLDPAASYCFEVPSHNLVLRHNNRIFITGNCGKDLSKADVSVNIYAFLKAQKTGQPVSLCCAIGDEKVDGVPYSEIVEEAGAFIQGLGGFEKFAEWGLV